MRCAREARPLGSGMQKARETGRFSVENRPVLSLGNSPHLEVRYPFVSDIVRCAC